MLIAVAVGMQFFTPPVFRPTVRFDAHLGRALLLELAVRARVGQLPDARRRPEPGAALLVAERRGAVLPRLAAAPARSRSARPARATRVASLRLRVRGRRGCVGGASLAYSLVETAAQPAIAYFETTTRVWEFAAGAALALGAPSPATRARVVAALAGRASGLRRSPRPRSSTARRPSSRAPPRCCPSSARPRDRGGRTPPARRRRRAPLARGRSLRRQDLLRLVPLALALSRLRTHGALGAARRPHRLSPRPCSPSRSRSLLAVVTHALVEVPARRASWFAVDRRRVAPARAARRPLRRCSRSA